MLFRHNNIGLFCFISRQFLSKPHFFSSISSSPRLSKTSCIQYLKNCKSMTHLKQIQTQIFRVGLHQDHDTLNKLMVFCTDPSLGNLHYAEKIFNYIQNPSLFIYNVLIKAFAKKGSFKKSIWVFGQLRKHGLWPDNFTYPYVFKAIGCIELGKVENFKKLFDEMSERDRVSWNVLISGYVRRRRFEDAVNVFWQMQRESNEKPDEATVVSTLSACTALKNLELARQIFDEMHTKNVICWTSMVSGYVNCGELDEARELFEKSPTRDIVLWTAMINGYVQFNCFDEAVALFREMQIRRVKPDKFTVVALLTGCAQLGALEQGKWIHGYIDENRISVDTVVGTSLIEMYAKCGCVEKSLDIFCELKEKDTASWTSIICGLAMNGKTSKALELFLEMKQAGASPDDITFIGVLSACGHGGLVKEGRQFFNSMTKQYEIEPKLEHYGCLIDLLGRAGKLDEAEKLIEEVPKENNEIVVPLYGSLLSACRIHGDVEMGERVAERLVKIESSDSSIHTLLANIYASADRWEDVTKVRRKMKDLGVKKVPGCSSIEVNGIVHEFVVGDPSHSEMREIYSMIDRMARPLLDSEESEIEREILVPVCW
ncbi:pentatricopeptide repeat-containing protein At1g31430-like isoform X3 [Castanea sativa]|uniref:pentatricopeptide repeat-containing protein At1g31430-like isoform X3 n=1 Tax=Castanea sativa TaxID=21020 RepID=UPI003F6506EE